MAALGHDYTAETTAPTCEKAGYTAYTCACGDSYTADEVAALGHDYTAEVTAPTCTQDGKTVYTCGNCGHAYSEKLAALGHDYSCVEADGCKVYTCGNCGDSYTERLNLTYTKVSTVEADNRYVITFEAGKEYYAMSHKDNTISIAKVTISNNEITSEVTEDLIWTYADNKLSYEDDDQVYYLYAAQTATTAARAGDQKAGTNKKPGGPGAAEAALTVSTTEFSTVTIDDQKIMVGSYYLHGNKDKIKLENKGSKSIFFVEG